MGLYGQRAKIDIAGISEIMQPVVEGWMNAEITLYYPATKSGTYDRWTNTKTGSEMTEIWSGAARMVRVRIPFGLASDESVTTSTNVRFQLPLDAEFDGDVLAIDGLRIRVDQCDLFPDAEHFDYVVMTALNSSFAWNRTIECAVDMSRTI